MIFHAVAAKLEDAREQKVSRTEKFHNGVNKWSSSSPRSRGVRKKQSISQDDLSDDDAGGRDACPRGNSVQPLHLTADVGDDGSGDFGKRRPSTPSHRD
ncbi:hypothetical protein U9M48_013986 [Paspalum notatum var. saurae]|uniref:Uncharacterized protein n=1 Tax=Paspalum notatum var. saurae TaxID=547442 RepID=A0AAQ3T3C3_PASNO